MKRIVFQLINTPRVHSGSLSFGTCRFCGVRNTFQVKTLSSELETEKQRYSELEERKGSLEEQLQDAEDWKSTCVCGGEPSRENDALAVGKEVQTPSARRDVDGRFW